MTKERTNPSASPHGAQLYPTAMSAPVVMYCRGKLAFEAIITESVGGHGSRFYSAQVGTLQRRGDGRKGD